MTTVSSVSALSRSGWPSVAAARERSHDINSPCSTDAADSCDALQAFFQEQQYCGELDGGVEGDRVWMTCTCGAAINRLADVTAAILVPVVAFG
jgi:hypothetical protein